MPIYEYKCDLCNGLWEEIQKFSDEPLTVCKSCEMEGGVHKLFTGKMSFILKGGGWYTDGYLSTREKEIKQLREEASEATSSTKEKERKEVNEYISEGFEIKGNRTRNFQRESKREDRGKNVPSGGVDAGEVQTTTACQPDRQDSSSA